MRKKRYLLFACVLLATLSSLAWLVLGHSKPEPAYNGKRLSFWLTGFDTSSYQLAHPHGPAPPSYQEAEAAIQAMGTNAIPVFLRQLQTHDSKLKTAVMGLLTNQHLIAIHYAPPNPYRILTEFRALGAVASNAVPRLIEIFEQDPSPLPQTAIPEILGAIGPAAAPAIPTLLRGLNHTNEWVRYNSIYAIGRIHSQPGLAVPALTKCLNDPAAYIRWQAILALCSFRQAAASAVPHLCEIWRTESLKPETSHMIVCGHRVATSWAALPALARSNPDLAFATAEALKAIDPVAAANVGVK